MGGICVTCVIKLKTPQIIHSVGVINSNHFCDYRFNWNPSIVVLHVPLAIESV